MKFNIAYLGPERLFHLRRDFILLLKFTLEDLGHDVVLSDGFLDAHRFNLIIGAYFQPKDCILQIAGSGFKYAHINTEVIANDMLNHNPKKVDFLNVYLPSLYSGSFVWDVIKDNESEYMRYGLNAHFLRWGAHPKMRDIQHRKNKDLDFYFFGMLSNRRKIILQKLKDAGLKGLADHSCPYFIRNDRISRSKIQLNLIQDEIYTHVNSFRICYLANNGCCILSEREHDPADYLKYTEVVEPENLIEKVRNFLTDFRWKSRGERAAVEFSEQKMNDVMERLLDQSFERKHQ